LRAALDCDIGIEGKKLKVDGRMVDAYYFCVGGSVGEFASIARPSGIAARLPRFLTPSSGLLREFNEQRASGENLRSLFLARPSNEQIRAWLAGEFVAAVDRDLPPLGPVPLGVEG